VTERGRRRRRAALWRRLRTGGSCTCRCRRKRRCSSTAGRRGVGAPEGNRSNWRDGFHSREMKAERRRINGFIRSAANAQGDRGDERYQTRVHFAGRPSWSCPLI